jgi:GT2 family glycosyltransferase/peptidoglycan/xylan/chitin deacetylase (PgdA/CDA1 family)
MIGRYDDGAGRGMREVEKYPLAPFGNEEQPRLIEVSVVVPTYNRWTILQRCLTALLNQNIAPDRYELIVVSDGSTDYTVTGMVAFTSDPHVRFLKQSNQGAAAAMNAGIREAVGELILIIDDDCICDPGIIGAHIEAHKDAARTIVIGPVFLHPDSPKTAASELLKRSGERDFNRSKHEGLGRNDLMLCANSSIRRPLFQEHWFDPQYRRSWDIELGIRLQRAGVQVRYAPNAIAYQLNDKSAGALVDDAVSLTMSEVKLAGLYPESRTISSIAAWSLNPPWKRAARVVIARAPISPGPVLALLFSISHSLRRIPLFMKVAQRLLSIRIGVAACRAAVVAAGSWSRLREMFLRRVPVLLYHHVTSDSDRALTEISMPRSVFEKQMNWLARGGYTGIGLSQYLAWRDESAPLPPKPVLITFDDAYSDTSQHAFPILERHHFPAGCMVVSGEIGKLNSWDSDLGWPPLRLMDEEALHLWNCRGVEYGAHTCTHRDLPRLDDRELEIELGGSRQAIEQMIGCPVRTFAYPYGVFDRRVQLKCREYFDLAFTTRPRVSTLATDPLLVGRIEPAVSGSHFGFLCRMRWGWSPVPRVIAKLSRMFLSLRMFRHAQGTAES